MTFDVADNAEIAVIGGGIMGAAVAYFLSSAGRDVVLLDRGNLNCGGSGTNAGSLHLQIYIHPHHPEDWVDRVGPSLALLRESAVMWSDIENELQTDCGVHLGGGLWVAETHEEMRLIENKVEAEQKAGIESTRMSRDELLRVAPYLGEYVSGGSYLKGEGIANPLLVTPAYASRAKQSGARIEEMAEVLGIERHRGGCFEIETSRGHVTAGTVIVACGGWTGQMCRMAGLRIPVTGRPAQVSVTEGRPNIMGGQLLQHVGMGLTLKQSAQGAYLIGGGWPGHFDTVQSRSVPRIDSIVGNCWVAARTVPDVGSANLVRSWSGMGSNVEDGMPIIGDTSEIPGLYVLIAPLGFTMGPICARLLSEHILHGEATVPLAPFSPERFNRVK